jgi:hypothetical protein
MFEIKPSRGGKFYLISSIRTGLAGWLCAIAAVLINLLPMPTGIGIRPVGLFLILILIDLVTATAGTVQAVAGVYLSKGRIRAIPLGIVGFSLSLAPFFIGRACVLWVLAVRHLRLED